MSETLSRNQDEAARNAGEDFPRLLGSFVKGMFAPRKRDGDDSRASTRPSTPEISPIQSEEERKMDAFGKFIQEKLTPVRKRRHSEGYQIAQDEATIMSER